MQTEKYFNLYSKIVLTFFILMVFAWGLINIRGLENLIENYIYGAMMGILPILGALFGFLNSSKWGGHKSAIGRSVLFLSAGLLTWGIGTLIFSFYNFTSAVEVPYPSFADLAYIISWPLWIVGMINLSKATGAKFQLRKSSGKIFALILPVVLSFLSYYLLIVVARGGYVGDISDSTKLFFDLAYPIGDLFILTVSLLVFGLSFNYLGGVFKIPIMLILMAFVFNYFADFGFSYTTTQETFFVANWVDLLFTCAMFCLSYGVALMDPSKLELARHEHNNV